MKMIRIAWIVSILLFVPMIAVCWLANSQQRKEKAKVNQEIEGVKIRIEKLEDKDPELENLKKIGNAALGKLSESKDNWWYLGELEGIKKKYKPYFRNISASRIKEDQDFKTYSRLVKMSSSFSEVMDLIGSLESYGGFKVEGIDIQANEKDSRKHDVEFWLSFSRVKEVVVQRLAGALMGKEAKKIEKNYYTTSLRLKPSWKKNQMLALKKGGRDPFVNLKKRREEWLEKLKEEQEAKQRARLAKLAGQGAIDESAADIDSLADFSDQLVLKGILSIKGMKMAILDAQYEVIPGRKNLYRYNVKVGDFVGEKEVIRIEDKQVFLKADDMTYLTMMR